jgi:transcriptional regulator with XRE-family HTH domain
MPRTATSDVAAKVVGRAIRAARQEMGLTQADVAARLGVNPSYVTNLEAGRVNATIGQLAHIAEALGTGIDVGFPVLASEPVRMPSLPVAERS